MQSSRTADPSARSAAPPPPPRTGAPVASSRSHYRHHAPSTVRSSRYEGVPMSSSSMRGPLTEERNMMDKIRQKLERAQQRLAHQHAVQSSTPGTSRYYPPNYESSKARTPAPAVQSVKLEDFSLQQQHYVPQPPPSSTTSGYLGVYPPQPPSTHRGGFVDPHAVASHRHRHQQPQPSHHRDRAAAPATATASARPSRQSVPAPVHEPSARSTRPSASRHHQQQYPAELQYKSSSRNTATSDYQGTPLSSAAPFLVYSTSSRQPPPASSQKSQHRQFAPPSPMQAPAASARATGATEADRQHRQHRHDRTREPPPSAMRSAMQAPPSSRVRFEGHLDEFEEEERARAKLAEDRAREAEKAKLRQREKEEMHREFLLKERQKGSVSQDAAEQLPVERQERTRRGSLPTPPKSEIDVNVWQHVKAPLPASPTGRNRRGSSVVAAPPKSEIQLSGFEEAPVRRRSSAADQLPALSAETLKEDPVKNSAKRDTSSDEDEYTTPPTSPSSGASSSASGSSSGSGSRSVLAKETPISKAPEATNAPEEPPIQVNVKPVPAFRDYDDDYFLNQQASPTKKPHLSIWEEADEEAIISSSNQVLTPKQQDAKEPLIWDEEKEKSESGDKHVEPVSKNQEPSPKKETREETVSKEETPSPEEEPNNSENIAPLNQDVCPKEETVPEISSSEMLSPVMKPAAAPASSAYLGSRSASPARPDLRSRISAAIQALNSPDSGAPASRASRLPPTSPSSRLSAVAAAKESPPLSPSSRSPPSPPPLHPASEPRAAPTASMVPLRSSGAFQRPPSTTVGRPSVTRPRVPPLPPAPHSMYLSKHQHSSHGLPPSTGSTGQRRLRHREPLDLKRQLPLQISALEGLTSGTNTFPLNEYAFYEIEWRIGEFGFSFQRVYTEAYDDEKSEMFLRMLLNTERGTCKSFREVHVGDILIKIGDVKVSDLGFDTARDPGLALTKYFTELRSQTPMRLVFQRTEVLDWEGGVEL